MATLEGMGDLSLQGGTNQVERNLYEDLVRNVSRDVVSFSEREQQVLDLYETLQEFELERSMLEAQKTVRPVSVDDVSELHNQLGTAQEELLKAKAAYSLKRQITENVLMTDPIIKAVHSGTEAAFAERLLLPLVNRRDVLSMAHTIISSDLQSTSDSLLEAQRGNRRAMKENQELTSTLLSLVEETKAEGIEGVTDPNVRGQLSDLAEQIEFGKSRWRILKSVTGAVIVGSGVNWARKNDLRELVMDDEGGEPSFEE